MSYKTFFLRVLFLLNLLFISTQFVNAQLEEQGYRVGIKLPYTYDIGYFFRFNTRLAGYVSTQFITIPFSAVPINMMNMLGANADITAILKEPFSIGAGIDLGMHYYFGTDSRRYYFALNTQWMNLLKRDIKDKVINKAFNTDLNSADIPIGPIAKWQSRKPLTINTNYINIGIVFGKIIPLRKKKTELRLEIALSKTVYSHHNLQSDYRIITPIAQQTNSQLQSLFRKYGWFPSLNIYFIYKLEFKA